MIIYSPKNRPIHNSLRYTVYKNRHKLLNIYNKRYYYQDIGKLEANTGLEAVRQANIALFSLEKEHFYQ